jgi:electron transport complex protein RnfA
MASLALVFFAALSLNLVTHFATGIKELVARERTQAVQIYYPWVILFVSTALLWIFLARVLVFSGGIFGFVLVSPLAILGCMGLEKLFFDCFSQKFKAGENPGLFSAGSSYNALSAASLFLTLRFALSFADALCLAFSFSSGGLLAFLVIKEIQKRSFLEAIPHGLRGTPVLLISTGLLSLIFSAASVILLKIIV